MKDRVADAFGRADEYDDYAGIQWQVAQKLAGYIRDMPLPPAPRVLEIGCGTGFVAEAIGESLPGANWLMTDIAPAMVERSRARFGSDPRFRFAVVDGEHPTMDEPPFDLVCSSLAVQWFGELAPGLNRLLGLLRPGGRLVVSTLVAGSFAGWREAHDALRIDHGMRRYPTAEELVSLSLGGRTGDITFEWLEQRYANARAFLHALRAIGADTPEAGHRPLGAGRMRAVMRRFEEAGAVASYHVAFARFTA